MIINKNIFNSFRNSGYIFKSIIHLTLLFTH